MALKTMISNITKARAEYEKQKAALGENAQKAIAEAFAEFIPAGHVLHWCQYTPYFNDGDACTFGVHDPYFDEAADEEAESNLDVYDGGDLPKPLRKLWDSIPEDMFESAFGDHVHVIVRSDGTYTVDEHSHD